MNAHPYHLDKDLEVTFRNLCRRRYRLPARRKAPYWQGRQIIQSALTDRYSQYYVQAYGEWIASALEEIEAQVIREYGEGG